MSFKSPAFITFTGFDAHTSIERMKELSKLYPIEWGVLFSPSRQGQDPRYPALEVVETLFTQGAGLHLAAHLCGEYANEVIENGSCALSRLLRGKVARIQVNTTARDIDHNRLQWVSNSVGADIILQARDAEKFPPQSPHVFYLYDASGGRGIAPAVWPAHPGFEVGYAGGIRPQNVLSVLKTIQAAGTYWIDMESGVRTEDRFDLNLVEEVCRNVYPLRRPRPEWQAGTPMEGAAVFMIIETKWDPQWPYDANDPPTLAMGTYVNGEFVLSNAEAYLMQFPTGTVPQEHCDIMWRYM